MSLDTSNPLPIYRQIAQELTTLVLKGELKEGEKVPSTNELRRFYSVNATTAARALTTLMDEDIVEKRRGVGMFVRHGAREQVQEQGKAAFASSFLAPMRAEAEALGLSRADIDLLIDQVWEDPQKYYFARCTQCRLSQGLFADNHALRDRARNLRADRRERRG